MTPGGGMATKGYLCGRPQRQVGLGRAGGREGGAGLKQVRFPLAELRGSRRSC